MTVARDLLVVHAWPDSAALALEELRSQRAMTVIGVDVPEGASRPVARDLVRAAVRDLLATWVNQPVASIRLFSHPGQPIMADGINARLRLSVSHSAGLSVAAIHRHAAIGVDVMQVEQGESWMPDWERVALAYLGPHALSRLHNMAPEQRPLAFAQQWTGLEARLKCLSLPLMEWSPALEKSLASCYVAALALPHQRCGAIATRSDG